MARVRERRKHQRRAEEPGRDAAVRVLDHPRQRVADRRRARSSGQMPNAIAIAQPVCVVGAWSLQRAHVSRADLVAERVEPRRFVGVAEDPRRSRRQPRAVREERVGDEGRVGLRGPWPVRRRVGVEPVAELHRSGEQPVRPAPRDQGVDPAPHARQLALEDRWVAVRLVDRDRDHRGRVGPAGAAEARLARRARRPARLPARPAVGSWSIARSRSQLVQNASDSNSVDAVGANACASPVQPSRSSRCGQSVGTETKLSRCDQTTFSWKRVSAPSEQENVARGGRSRC